jgi:hypothetical protein
MEKEQRDRKRMMKIRGKHAASIQKIKKRKKESEDSIKEEELRTRVNTTEAELKFSDRNLRAYLNSTHSSFNFPSFHFSIPSPCIYP